MLSVLLRYMDYDYPFGIFKLFLLCTLKDKKAIQFKCFWEQENERVQTGNICYGFYLKKYSDFGGGKK